MVSLRNKTFYVLIYWIGLVSDPVAGLFEYVCEEKNLFKPYLHVYEHRKGRRIIEVGPGFHILGQQQNVYVCINGPAYLFYARTNELGQVYEAPQSVVFAHTCEMHNVVPHSTATKVDYVLHLMAVMLYGDKTDYRRPSIQPFTAPYFFDEDEYAKGFPAHYQNATSVAVIGDATCSLEKGNIAPILINFTPVWPAVVNTTTAAVNGTIDEEVERPRYVCKQGFSEFKELAKKETYPVPPALPALLSPDTSEPEPTLSGAVPFPTAKDKMRLLVNDELIKIHGCEAELYESRNSVAKLDRLTKGMEALHKKMGPTNDLTDLIKKYGEKIFTVRKSLEAQDAAIAAKKVKPGSSQDIKNKEKQAAIKVLIEKERQKYYDFKVKFETAKTSFEALGLTDTSGKVVDATSLKNPPEKVGNETIDFAALSLAAQAAEKNQKDLEKVLFDLEAELLKDLFKIKMAKVNVSKALDGPQGFYAVSKEFEDAIGKWALALSQAEVLHGILLTELNTYKQGHLELPSAKNKNKSVRLKYTERTVPQSFLIVAEGATPPSVPSGRKKRQVNDMEEINEGREVKRLKRQSPVNSLKCEKLPKLRGPDGECALGKPKVDEACALLAYSTGHQEAWPENSGLKDAWKKVLMDLVGDIFVHSCPNFFHSKKFVKRIMGAFSYYLTSDKHFNQLPTAGVSKACDAFEAWQRDPLKPVVFNKTALPWNNTINGTEAKPVWDDPIYELKKCLEAKRSLTFMAENIKNKVMWKFVRPRDMQHVEVEPYEEQADRENVFNWVIDMAYRIFSTAMGICMVGYDKKNSLLSGQFYHAFTTEFFLPLRETWVNPRDNLVFQWILGEFYNGDAEDWTGRCMEASYIFSDREAFRPPRNLLVNCRSEHNYFVGGKLKDQEGLFYSQSYAAHQAQGR